MPLFKPETNPLALPGVGRLKPSVHHFSNDEVLAIEMALTTGRPLLVRGEPGAGKSQLARAAAAVLKRPFLRHVINAHTEPSDLLWQFDRVARLAKAQIIQALGQHERAEAVLHPRNFVEPGPLWWALDFKGAQELHKRAAAEPAEQAFDASGAVLLLDEIDKADSAVPSGLLSVLGEGTFRTPWGTDIALAQETAPPLVVITTNEDRVLPEAFVRRCLVLHITLSNQEQELTQWLKQRGNAHFPEADEALLLKAAALVFGMRTRARQEGVCPPGLAEYIDLLRAVLDWADAAERLSLLEKLAPFALAKHQEIKPEPCPADSA